MYVKIKFDFFCILTHETGRDAKCDEYGRRRAGKFGEKDFHRRRLAVSTAKRGKIHCIRVLPLIWITWSAAIFQHDDYFDTKRRPKVSIFSKPSRSNEPPWRSEVKVNILSLPIDKYMKYDYWNYRNYAISSRINKVNLG